MLLPTFEFDSRILPTDEQFPAFVAHVANSRTTRPVERGPFLARARFWTMSPLLISEQRFDPFSFHRDEALIRSSPADHYSLMVMIEGGLRFEREGGDLFCDAGHASLSDVARLQTIHCSRRRRPRC